MTLTEQMRHVSTEMAELAKRMFATNDSEHEKHGDELYGAAMQVRGWAEYLKEEGNE